MLLCCCSLQDLFPEYLFPACTLERELVTIMSHLFADFLICLPACFVSILFYQLSLGVCIWILIPVSSNLNLTVLTYAVGKFSCQNGSSEEQGSSSQHGTCVLQTLACQVGIWTFRDFACSPVESCSHISLYSALLSVVLLYLPVAA